MGYVIEVDSPVLDAVDDKPTKKVVSHLQIIMAKQQRRSIPDSLL